MMTTVTHDLQRLCYVTVALLGCWIVFSRAELEEVQNGGREGQNITENEDQYYEWSVWSPCSRTCGIGIQFRGQRCLRKTKNLCRLRPRREYQTCNTQACPPGSIDFRNEQCGIYNGRDIFVNGERATWMSYIRDNNRCLLFCYPYGEELFYYFGRARDGTQCSREPYGVCIFGQCKPVGCDNVLQSGVYRDKCRVCGGNSTTCKPIRGRVKRAPTQFERLSGYAEVLVLPKGSTSVTLTDDSWNYLALRRQNGEYAINGNRIVNWPSLFKIDGMEVEYKRESDNIGETLRILGPTTEDLIVKSLLIAKEVNVTFEYWKPIRADKVVARDDPKVEQSPSMGWGKWTACSASCGGGIRVRSRRCGTYSMFPCTNGKTEVEDCNKQPCTELKGEWSNWGPWNACSASCGGGARVRFRFCREPRSAVRTSCSGERFEVELCNITKCPEKETAQSTAHGVLNNTTETVSALGLVIDQSETPVSPSTTPLSYSSNKTLTKVSPYEALQVFPTASVNIGMTSEASEFSPFEKLPVMSHIHEKLPLRSSSLVAQIDEKRVLTTSSPLLSSTEASPKKIQTFSPPLRDSSVSWSSTPLLATGPIFSETGITSQTSVPMDEPATQTSIFRSIKKTLHLKESSTYLQSDGDLSKGEVLGLTTRGTHEITPTPIKEGVAVSMAAVSGYQDQSDERSRIIPTVTSSRFPRDSLASTQGFLSPSASIESASKEQRSQQISPSLRSSFDSSNQDVEFFELAETTRRRKSHSQMQGTTPSSFTLSITKLLLTSLKASEKNTKRPSSSLANFGLIETQEPFPSISESRTSTLMSLEDSSSTRDITSQSSLAVVNGMTRVSIFSAKHTPQPRGTLSYDQTELVTNIKAVLETPIKGSGWDEATQVKVTSFPSEVSLEYQNQTEHMPIRFSEMLTPSSTSKDSGKWIRSSIPIPKSTSKTKSIHRTPRVRSPIVSVEGVKSTTAGKMVKMTQMNKQTQDFTASEDSFTSELIESKVRNTAISTPLFVRPVMQDTVASTQKSQLKLQPSRGGDVSETRPTVIATPAIPGQQVSSTGTRFERDGLLITKQSGLTFHEETSVRIMVNNFMDSGQASILHSKSSDLHFAVHQSQPVKVAPTAAPSRPAYLTTQDSLAYLPDLMKVQMETRKATETGQISSSSFIAHSQSAMNLQTVTTRLAPSTGHRTRTSFGTKVSPLLESASSVFRIKESDFVPLLDASSTSSMFHKTDLKKDALESDRKRVIGMQTPLAHFGSSSSSADNSARATVRVLSSTFQVQYTDNTSIVIRFVSGHTSPSLVARTISSTRMFSMQRPETLTMEGSLLSVLEGADHPSELHPWQRSTSQKSLPSSPSFLPSSSILMEFLSAEEQPHTRKQAPILSSNRYENPAHSTDTTVALGVMANLSVGINPSTASSSGEFYSLSTRSLSPGMVTLTATPPLGIRKSSSNRISTDKIRLTSTMQQDHTKARQSPSTIPVSELPLKSSEFVKTTLESRSVEGQRLASTPASELPSKGSVFVKPSFAESRSVLGQRLASTPASELPLKSSVFVRRTSLESRFGQRQLPTPGVVGRSRTETTEISVVSVSTTTILAIPSRSTILPEVNDTCRPCKMLTKRFKGYCTNDFVIHATILSEAINESTFDTSYRVKLIHTFKQSNEQRSLKKVWILNNVCSCPELIPNKEYILMGRMTSVAGSGQQIAVINRQSYVQEWRASMFRRLVELGNKCAPKPTTDITTVATEEISYTELSTSVQTPVGSKTAEVANKSGTIPPTEKPTVKCRRCRISKKRDKKYCASDYVIHAKVLQVLFNDTSQERKYTVKINNVFKNSVPLKDLEDLWVMDDLCQCPDLGVEEEYLIMGILETLPKPSARLIIPHRPYVSKWKSRMSGRLNSLRGSCNA